MNKHAKYERNRSMGSFEGKFFRRNKVFFSKKKWEGGANIQETVKNKSGECHNEQACQV